MARLFILVYPSSAFSKLNNVRSSLHTRRGREGCKMFSGRAQHDQDPGLLSTYNVIPVSTAALINKKKIIFIKENV